MQAYQKKKEVGELKGDVKPPGPLETFAEIIEEDGVPGGCLNSLCLAVPDRPHHAGLAPVRMVPASACAGF